MSTQSKSPGTTTRAKAPSPKLLLLAALVSLTGCASQSTLPPPLDQGLIDLAAQQHIQMHENYRPLALPRELMKPPQEPGHFSSRAEQSFKTWREKLTNSATKSEACTATSTAC